MPAIEVEVSQPQADLLEATERYVDAEGAIRSGKTHGCAEKTIAMVVQHPGINCFITRWSESDLLAINRPVWRELAAQRGLKLVWHADEEYDEVLPVRPGAPSSKVYIRGLKASEGSSRYAKFRGLTLGFIWCDQAEEIPGDVLEELKGRLSQPGHPHQLLLSPNPPGEDSWIAAEFPDDNSRPGYRYIRFTLDDNAAILGQDTVDAIKAAYPPGSAMRRRLIDGRRGLASVGQPVYKGYFNRDVHERSVLMDTECPLLEGWDFGHGHPAVVWEQRLPWGETRVLGGVMAQDMFLPDFAKVALQYRAQWFPNALEVWSTSDPAGEQHDNQGNPKRAVDILRDLGVICVSVPGANHPEKRNYAIQQTADAMRRRTYRGEAFGVHPRFALVTAQGIKNTTVLVDGFEAGYVWDDRAINNTTSPNTRRPKKDGFYDHTQNCHEYIELAFGLSQPTKVDVAKLQKQAVKKMQLDSDPADRYRVSAGLRRRGGY